MKLAVDTYSYYTHLGKHQFKPKYPKDLLWYLEITKRMKLDGVHIDPAHINYNQDLTYIKDFVNENLMYIELGAMEITEDSFINYLNTAKILGSKVLRTFTGGSCNDDRNTITDKVKTAKNKLQKMLPIIEKYKICVAVENHIDIFVDDLYYLTDIDSPYVGICFDSGNFAATGENVFDALKVFMNRIVCTHIKDACSKEAYDDAVPFGILGKEVHFCPLGEGFIPIPLLIGELIKAKGSDMNITLEIPVTLRSYMSENEILKLELENIKKSVEYMRNIDSII